MIINDHFSVPGGAISCVCLSVFIWEIATQVQQWKSFEDWLVSDRVMQHFLCFWCLPLLTLSEKVVTVIRECLFQHHACNGAWACQQLCTKISSSAISQVECIVTVSWFNVSICNLTQVMRKCPHDLFKLSAIIASFTVWYIWWAESGVVFCRSLWLCISWSPDVSRAEVALSCCSENT